MSQNITNEKTFKDLAIIEPILKSIAESNYVYPTPIQAKAIPILLQKKDLLGCAQTGTGKTAAFALPLLQNMYLDNKVNSHSDDVLAKNQDFKIQSDSTTNKNSAKGKRPQKLKVASLPKTLILAPTRELALQIFENFQNYGKYLNLRSVVIFGGVGQFNQVNEMEKGVDILIATPGRLLDLYEQRLISFKHVKTFVLDEADRMLDMGFIKDIQKILPLLPKDRHNLFFSATMPHEAKKLAQSILLDPVRVEITPPTSTAEKIQQFVYYVEKTNKKELLKHLLLDPALNRVIVFTRTKHAADRLSEFLVKSKIQADSIHGDKSQGARQRALENFKNNEIQVLIATDIMARGIDVDEVSHVINFEVSHQIEDYIHRIGRTARAGHAGIALSFCDAEEKSFVFAIEKTTGVKMEVIKDHPFHSAMVEGALIMSVGKAKAQLEAQRKSNRNQNDRRHSGKPKKRSFFKRK